MLCFEVLSGVSPNTVVYTTFQLEKMKGMGINNGWSNAPHWNLIGDHTQNGKIDAIGFTSYPYFEFSSPSTIPTGYYDEISQHWTGPVVFSEIGWLAAATPPYPGGEQQQVDFVTAFFDLTQNLELANVVWLFLHDLDAQTVQPAFDQIGLRNNMGNVTRPGDAVWQGEVALRQK